MSYRSLRLHGLAVIALMMTAGCPLPYDYSGPGAGAAHTTDPSSPKVTQPVKVSYAEQGGASGEIADADCRTTSNTTTVTLSTPTNNSVIYYTDDGSTVTNLRSAKKMNGSSGDMTILRTTSLQTMVIHAMAVGPDMLPSLPICVTVRVSPYPVLSITRDKASVSEDGGTATFTIAASSPLAAGVTVRLVTGGDYQPADVVSPFPAHGVNLDTTMSQSGTSFAVQVTGQHDPANANHTVTLTILEDPTSPPAVPAYVVGNPSSASVVLQDDGSFNVTYDGNNSSSGTPPLDPNYYQTGATVKVLGNAGMLTKTGSVFTGWNTQANGNGTAYAPGQTFAMGSANVTLYAMWAPAFTVTYNANGATGSVPVDSNGYVPGQQVTTLGNTGNLAKSGCAFAGWTANPNATGPSASYATGTKWTIGSSSVTLYAIWIPSELAFSSSGNAISITGYSTAPTGALVIPPGVTSIGGFTFCSGITSVSVPSSVTSIASYTFQSCSGLTSVTLSPGVASIGNFAFAYTGLTGSVTIPASVTSVGGVAFAFCSQLSSIVVDPSNPNYLSISGVLFDKTVTTLVQVPNAMAGSYVIPTSVTSIAWAALGGCSKLTSVAIPPSVRSIGNSAFWYCTGLTSIAIPSGVASIEDDAFGGCTGVTTVTIPAGVTSVGQSPFIWCSGLASIFVDSSNPSYSSSSGVLFDKSQTLLLEAPAATTSCTIPPTVTTIGVAAFAGCRLSGVIVPSNVTSISYSAFTQCSMLASVTMLASTPPALPASSNAFSNVASGFAIHVPDAAAVATYKAATGWSDYASVIVTP